MNQPIVVPMLDLPACHEPLAAELEAVFRKTLESGRFILGPEVEALERDVAQIVGVEHAIGMSSGTDALLAGMMALDIGPGDEVLCPAFTFFATGGCVSRLGATPVFVDTDEATFNSRAEDFEARISERTKALIVVHLYGRCAEMGPILELAKRHGLPVIEDTAQALGATSPDGRAAGGVGTLATYSFFPTKNLGALGDAGMTSTDDDELAARMRSLRAHGESRKYHHAEVGGNFRIDALQASFLRVKLPHLSSYNEARRSNAQLYSEILSQHPLIGAAGSQGASVTLPDLEDRGQIFHQFVLRIGGGRRDSLRAFMAARGVQTEVYYPTPLHLQPCFANLGYRVGDLPKSERLAAEVLALPIFPELGRDRIELVCEGIQEWLDS